MIETGILKYTSWRSISSFAIAEIEEKPSEKDGSHSTPSALLLSPFTCASSTFQFLNQVIFILDSFLFKITDICSFTTSISSSSPGILISGRLSASSGDVFYNRFNLPPIYIIPSLIYLVIITSCTGSQRRALKIWPTSSNIFPSKTISNTKDTEQMREVLSHQSKWRRWKEDFVHQRSQLWRTDTFISFPFLAATTQFPGSLWYGSSSF